MKNPFEGMSLFKKKENKEIIDKQKKDAALAAAAALIMANPLNAQTVEGQTKTQDAFVPQTEMSADAASNKDSVDMASLEWQRQAQINSLAKEKTKIETEIQQLTAHLQGLQTDFQHNYQQGLEFSGKKVKTGGLEMKIADLAMKMGREKVAKFDITSKQAVDGIMGILLSGSGDFSKEVNDLNNLMGGQLGSTVMESTGRPGKYESPDMKIHKHLGEDPRFIVETALKIVKEEHKLNEVKAKLQTLQTPAQASL